MADSSHSTVSWRLLAGHCVVRGQVNLRPRNDHGQIAPLRGGRWAVRLGTKGPPSLTHRRAGWNLEVGDMTKSLVVKLFWGSLLGLVAGSAAYVIAGPHGLKAKD